MHKALHLRDDIDSMCQEKKEKEVSRLTLKIAWMHQCDDQKAKSKSTKNKRKKSTNYSSAKNEGK